MEGGEKWASELRQCVGGGSARASGYSSELEGTARPDARLDLLLSKPPVVHEKKPSFYDHDAAERRRVYGAHMAGMDAYSRHKKYINDFVLFYGSKDQYCKPRQKEVTDLDILRQEHRFLRDDDEDYHSLPFEQKVAKQYYDRLFKEYCLADLSHFKEGKIGLRWRTQNEVFSGRGHFSCGNKACASSEGLVSYEVNFRYSEAGEEKNALVKLRLCRACGPKISFYREKEKAKLAAMLEKKRRLEVDLAVQRAKRQRLREKSKKTTNLRRGKDEEAQGSEGEGADVECRGGGSEGDQAEWSNSAPPSPTEAHDAAAAYTEHLFAGLFD
mmetsp:Transcript_49040/g.123363  ORF Transcript_49040/g.123363 Transcript_49040/m.123363 type:complete len:328 (+) Transcript_49040:213-1196(+)